MTAEAHARRYAAARWFHRPVPRPAAPVRLFCLPYAGAGASVFRRWPAAFGPDVEVLPVTLPGRESRFGEPAVIDPAEVSEALADQADRPYALYGHSLGARLAYEATRVLWRRGGPLPVCLYLGAATAPGQARASLLDGVADLPRDELLARLVAGGGLSAALLGEPELLDLVLPVLRSDLVWLDGLPDGPVEPLPVPLVTFAGTHDGVLPPSGTAGWERHTTAGRRAHVLPGGHFFLHDRLDDLAGLIGADLRERTR